MIQLLNNQKSRDVVLLGIWGMGGIGKTTIAKAIYNQIGCTFEGRSFLPNIREVWEQDTRHVYLQERLLSDIDKATKTTIHNFESGKLLLKERLRHKRVLIVLDDVNKLDQLNAFCGSREWFGPGSRIIITTRDKHILRVQRVDHVCRMIEMDESESVELFSWHAFKQSIPREDFAELSRNVVAYSGGLPLALEVLGSYLFGSEKAEWESALEKLKRIPNDQVHKKLEISFDGLSDDTEKEIFLDIACFFIGMDRNDVINILNGCGLFAEIGISVLVERCLVTVDQKNKLGMHDLLRDMGREIIREKSPKEPEKRSRLWFHEDVLDVLSKHTGTRAVEGLALKLPRINTISLNTKAFKKMKKLRLLQLAGVKLTGDFEYLSRDLRWLCWHGFPLTCTPANFCQGSLVAMELEHSNLTLVWHDAQLLEKLKILRLSHSHYLTQTPDFSYLPNLEKLVLKDCPSLSAISYTIGHLNKILLINLEDCTGLRKLPRSIYKLKSLKTLILSGCSKIDKLEEDLEQMQSLTTLIADKTAITQVPFSIVRSKSIGLLSLCGYEGFARDVFPSIIWSWMSARLSSLLQTSVDMLSVVSLDLPSSSSSVFHELPKLRSLCVKCDTKTELYLEVATILDTLNAASQASTIKTPALIGSHSEPHNSESRGSMNSLLVRVGMNSQATNILEKSILQKLTTDDQSLPGDNYPDWLTFNRDGSSVAFEVPHVNGRNLKTMMLCMVYEVDPSVLITLEGLTNILIINYTKATIHIYKQDTLTSEDEGWHNLISTLEPGNEVELVTIFGSGSTVKITAVYLVYYEPSGEETEHWHASDENVLASGSDKKPRICDVYLSFSGEDTVASFISHLYTSFQNAGIYVSKDLEALPRGDKLSTLQLQAIEESSIAVIVFSRKYADSMWCLEELEKIMKCRRTIGQVVVPVFYGVDHSEVRHQTGMFGQVFRHFLKRMPVDLNKRMIWEKALLEGGRTPGYVFNDSRSQSEGAKNVVQCVTHLLESIESKLQVQVVIEEWKEQQQSDNVRLLGIWGMGGIGKTTFGRAIYKQIGDYFDFDGSSFLPNIREAWQKDTRHVSLQERLLFDICPAMKMSIRCIESGKKILKKKLCCKKVLILLDHVNKWEQLEALCGSREWFGPGSIIIITTRDKHLLSELGVDYVHTMREMGETESLQLFSSHAFDQASPKEGFVEISRNVVEYCGGLPLALVVLGDLFRKEEGDWKSVLDRLKRIPHPEIHKVLKISFDDLNDKGKKIFLDIAFYFIGMDREDVTRELKGFGSFAETGIDILDEQSLVIIGKNNKLGMHVLLRDMAKEIIREQTRMGPEKRIYDVFLSFRGQDTRSKFISHLYTSLKNAGINVFKDNEENRKGNQISFSLFEAIEKSEISIIVLSTHYANSRWCLKELQKIMECYRNNGQVVKPVFYEVEPSDVRYQVGEFGKAFEDLKKKISMDEDKVQRWTTALRVIGGISGFVVKNTSNESDEIKKIVEDVTRSLDRTYMQVALHPVGVESHVQKVVEQLYEKQPQDPLILGIWGMGGIGKTTIAKAVFNKIGRNFEGRSFLSNIREDWKENKDKVSLQNRLLWDICETTEEVTNIDSGKTILKKRLCQRRLLLVLDDVSDKEQLHALCGSREWFGKGSRVIITTRDITLLTVGGLKVDSMYEMTKMGRSDSVELFSRHAFNQGQPLREFAGLSSDVVKYCQGLPLALGVLGSYFGDIDESDWESELETLKSIPHDDVMEQLRISFDGLKCVEEKAIFLHIAFFFIGVDQNYVIQILDDCELHPKSGISVLVQRCLVTVDNNNKLGMHDLLRDMGRRIVREESIQNPGMRSRLWDPKEVINVLSQNAGTNSVEGLTLKFPSRQSSFGTKAFVNMKQLKLLQFASVQLDGNFGHLSQELRWLYWHGFPLKYIPADFCLKGLVAIELEHSKLELLWEKGQELEKLKILNLSHSHHLRQTPRFSFLPVLEQLILEDCPNLASVCDTIGHLDKLLLINLKGCTNLRKLPRSLYKLKSLKSLDLSGCSKIDKLKEDLEQMESLAILTADETAITRVPFAVVRSKSIGYISLCGFKGLSRDVFPSITWSWICEHKRSWFGANNLLSLVQAYVGMSLVSLEVPSCSFHVLSSILKEIRKLRSLWVYCDSDLQLNATSCKGTPSTLQVSNMENSLNCLLIQMGMNCHVTNAFKDSMLQTLSSSGTGFFPGDNFPHWRTYKSESSSVSFEVPQVKGHKLKTMMCFVYYSSPDNLKSEGLKYVLIINYTKTAFLVYSHSVLTSEDEDWKSISLEPGNEVKVVVFHAGFIVKMTAVSLIFEESFNNNVEHCHASGASTHSKRIKLLPSRSDGSGHVLPSHVDESSHVLPSHVIEGDQVPPSQSLRGSYVPPLHMVEGMLDSNEEDNLRISTLLKLKDKDTGGELSYEVRNDLHVETPALFQEPFVASSSITTSTLSPIVTLSSRVCQDPVLYRLSFDDAALLSEFFTKFPSTLHTEAPLQVSYMVIAYKQLVKLLRFLYSHNNSELWGDLHGSVLDQLGTIRCFGFQGQWLDDLYTRFNQPLLKFSLKDLKDLEDDECCLAQENHVLEQQIDGLTSRLEVLKLELLEGKAKEASLVERKARLLATKAFHDAPFSF